MLYNFKIVKVLINNIFAFIPRYKLQATYNIAKLNQYLSRSSDWSTSKITFAF